MSGKPRPDRLRLLAELRREPGTAYELGRRLKLPAEWVRETLYNMRNSNQAHPTYRWGTGGHGRKTKVWEATEERDS